MLPTAAGDKNLSVLGGGLLFYFEELLVEVGEGVEAAFIANVYNAIVCLDEQLAGIAYPDFVEEIDVCFFCAFFEIIAKGWYAQARYGGHIF